ncbi:MAG: hypothetical protein KUG78_15025 [Kangiellaceae bacterium]|nr:hypothetical protein [Kangiellaceae bacterium]
MNIAEAKAKLEQLGINNNSYSMDDSTANEKYCVFDNYGKWSVYYSERGNRNNEKIFDSESDALEYFVELVSSDSTI